MENKRFEFKKIYPIIISVIAVILAVILCVVAFGNTPSDDKTPEKTEDNLNISGTIYSVYHKDCDYRIKVHWENKSDKSVLITKNIALCKKIGDNWISVASDIVGTADVQLAQNETSQPVEYALSQEFPLKRGLYAVKAPCAIDAKNTIYIYAQFYVQYDGTVEPTPTPTPDTSTPTHTPTPTAKPTATATIKPTVKPEKSYLRDYPRSYDKNLLGHLDFKESVSDIEGVSVSVEYMYTYNNAPRKWYLRVTNNSGNEIHLYNVRFEIAITPGKWIEMDGYFEIISKYVASGKTGVIENIESLNTLEAIDYRFVITLDENKKVYLEYSISEENAFKPLPSNPLPTTAKPVIYLYPTKETNVSVKLDFDGDLKYTYPIYNGGWNVVAKPDGTLNDPETNKEYYYLFWEGYSEFKLDFSKGYCVKGEDTVKFLEKILSEMGLTPREYNDFIVYWLPHMQDNEYNLIAFQQENYTECAKLEISPSPDSVLRVFMAFLPLSEYVEIEAPEIIPFERNGFTVIEWGGKQG